MEENIKRYEIVSKVESNMVVSQTIVAMFLTIIFVILNVTINLNLAWNICFAFPALAMYFGCIVLDYIANFRVGKYTAGSIEKNSRNMSTIIFVSNIVFFCLIFTAIMYILLSVVLFS